MTDLLLLAVATLYAVLYAAGVRRVRQAGRPWPAVRTGAFVAGLVIAVAVLASPLADRADQTLTAHMWQHLALTLVVAPLLVGGAPVALALHRALLGVVRSRAIRVVTHPLATWTAFTGTVAVTHLTAWYDAALRDSLLHGLEHAAYLGSAMLFWAPVIGANPLRALRSWIGRTIYLIVAMVPMSTVSVLLVYAQDPRYPTYAHRAGSSAAALVDQQNGGDIMWVIGSMVMVGATVAVGFDALLREERRQRAVDALEDASRREVPA
jgi:putative copper resistance protein D